MDLKQLRQILAQKYFNEFTPVDLLKVCGAYWRHDGQGYYNIMELMKFPNVRKFVSRLLVDKLRRVYSEKRIDVVVSSSYSFVTGQAVSDKIGCVSVCTERVTRGQMWTGKVSLPAKVRILLVENLITTTETVTEVINALDKALGHSNFEFITYEGKIVVVAVGHCPAKLPIEYDNFY